MPTLSNGNNRWVFSNPPVFSVPTNPVITSTPASGSVTIEGTPINDTTMVINISNCIINTGPLGANPPLYFMVTIPEIIPNQFRSRTWSQIGTVLLTTDDHQGPVPFDAMIHTDASGSITLRTTEQRYFANQQLKCPGLVLTVARR